LSVPGRSRRWALAPIAPAALWIGLSGLGCYRDLLRTGSTGLEIGHSGDCLVFIVGASLLIGLPLLWRLSRARPIDPLPVALLGGLGTAALAALLLQFFHPFAVTFVDLGFHLAAVMTVVALAAALRRPMLRPA
ncbi:MAG: NrsF family protein, partial [Pseudomonadota bacterium]|nr:NrsF family protein [Pseudomonadota bacterium]